MADQIRRGGSRRPVVLVRGRALALPVLMAAAWVLVTAGTASAHGGVATMQLGAERINPGGTLELIGDMSSDRPITVTMVADVDGAARAIATLGAGDDGHLQAFVTLPLDVPEGSYTITAANGVDLTRAPVIVSGAPVSDGEPGQLTGRDEALASLHLAGGAQAAGSSAPAIPASERPSEAADAAQIPVVVLLALGLALGFGAAARLGGRRVAAR